MGQTAFKFFGKSAFNLARKNLIYVNDSTTLGAIDYLLADVQFVVRDRDASFPRRMNGKMED